MDTCIERLFTFLRKKKFQSLIIKRLISISNLRITALSLTYERIINGKKTFSIDERVELNGHP